MRTYTCSKDKTVACAHTGPTRTPAEQLQLACQRVACAAVAATAAAAPDQALLLPTALNISVKNMQLFSGRVAAAYISTQHSPYSDSSSQK